MTTSSTTNRIQTTTTPTGAPITMSRIEVSILGDFPSECDTVGVFADISDIEVNGSIDGVDVLPVIAIKQVLFAHRGCTRLCVTVLILLQFLSDEELIMTRP